ADREGAHPLRVRGRPAQDPNSVQTTIIRVIASPATRPTTAAPRAVVRARSARIPTTTAATATGSPQTKPSPGRLVPHVRIEPGTDRMPRMGATYGSRLGLAAMSTPGGALVS